MTRIGLACLYCLWILYVVGTVLVVIGVQLLKLWPSNPLFTLTSIVFLLFALNHALLSIGLRRGLTFFLLTAIISLAFEAINLLSGGWVFGPLQYTSKLGIKFFGLVPVLIPLTWFTVGYLSLCIAHRIIGHWPRALWRRIQLAATAAVIMTCWDFGMDPAMVAKGYWVWLAPGHYFGIPLHNFAGWLVTTFCFTFVWLSLLGTHRSVPAMERQRGHRLLAPSAYGVLCVSISIINLDMGQLGPALIGFLSMGVFAFYWVRTSWRTPLQD